MINDIGVTEFQIQLQTKWGGYDQQSSQPRGKNKSLADFAAHDGHLMQGFADGHVVVIAMAARRENSVTAKKSVKNTCLMQVLIQDGIITCCDVIEISRDMGSCE